MCIHSEINDIKLLKWAINDDQDNINIKIGIMSRKNVQLHMNIHWYDAK